MTRVLIADDELPARQRLRQLLAFYPDFEIVAEAESGAQTMELVESTRPDLLLLDIQMPEGTGLDVAACLPSPRPAIIFCTAYEQHAVDAFELAALDYLLKPVSRVRLNKSLEKFPPRLPQMANPALDRLLQESEQRLTRFLVRSGGRYLVIPNTEVAYFESKDGLTRLVTTAGKEYWLDPPLNELELRVDPRQFYRVSRSALANVNSIESVQPFAGGNGLVHLKGNVQLDVSRRRIRDLLKLLDGA